MSELFDKLNAYYRSQGIHPLDFRCPSRGSCSAGSANFTEARSALIGRSYGDPIRIVVLSLDPGSGWADPHLRTLEGYSSHHSTTHIDSFPKNRHWYRTFETVAALISQFGSPRSPADVFENIAHVNAAKCCLNLPSNKQAPRHVFENCRDYLSGEMLILEPHVIVTQGDKAAVALQRCCHGIADAQSPVVIEGHQAFWIRLVHPTAWGGAYVAEQKSWGRLFAKCLEWIKESGTLK